MRYNRNMENFEAFIGRCKILLHRLGVSPKSIGYQYLVGLFVIATQKPIYPLYKVGYAELAEKVGKSSSAIDKSIQNALSSACNRTDNSEFYRVFGCTISEDKGKPTNMSISTSSGRSHQMNRPPSMRW